MLNVWQWLAIVVCALGLVGCAAYFVGMRRTNYNAVQMGFFLIAWGLTRILWRTSSPGQLPLPKGQGAVLVCNHRSSVDPFFIQVVAHRRVHWMVAREFCENGFIGWFLRSCEVIPVGRRGVDTAATRAAIRYATQGDMVGVFPEGRINTTEELLLPVRPGAAMMALIAGVPILPCYIENAPYNGTAASPMFMRARVKVKFGEPIDIRPYLGKERNAETLQELTLRCMKQIAVLAGRGDFEPTLAGRQWREAESSEASDNKGDGENRESESESRQAT